MTQPFELTHEGGLPIDADNPMDVLDQSSLRRYGTGRIPYAKRRTANDQIVPSVAGKAIRVVWVSVLPADDNTAPNPVTIKFNGATDNLYTGEIIGHWESFEGGVDEPVDILLTNVQPVDVNIHYEEF